MNTHEQKIKIFMSGPIRPSVIAVRDVIKNIKEHIPNSILILSHWETNENVYFGNVDHQISTVEPSISEIHSSVYARTWQQKNHTPHNGLEHWTANIYKMFLGMKKIIDYVEDKNLCQPDDIIVRIRTDLQIVTRRGYLQNTIENKNLCYNYFDRVSATPGIDDHFGISDYKTMKTAWYFYDFAEYNMMVNRSWNAEEILKNNLELNNIRINKLSNEQILERYIVRTGGVREAQA